MQCKFGSHSQDVRVTSASPCAIMYEALRIQDRCSTADTELRGGDPPNKG